ncbi:MAG TPA: hypothetical protein VMW52_07180 [Phycisphaerae bacterium]|nr:hypothetical protein [Phycisphaerae bacterium]
MRRRRPSSQIALLKAGIRRMHAEGNTDAQMAAVIDVDRRIVQEFRRRMGLVANGGRMYRPEELAVVRAEYGRTPTPALAKKLGRTVTSIYQTAARLHLVRPTPRLEKRPGLIERLRARHAEGWSDAEIGREVGTDRHHFGKLRRKLGLAANVWSEHLRERVRRNTAEQLRKAGLPSIGYLRVEAFKKYARDRGWPEDLKPRQVQILELLWDRGPMTREEIGRALGMTPKPRKTSKGGISYWYPMHCNTPGHGADSSYTGDLLRRGLIISLGRVVRYKPAGARTGQSRNACLYSLPLTIERNAHVTEG